MTSARFSDWDSLYQSPDMMVFSAYNPEKDWYPPIETTVSGTIGHALIYMDSTYFHDWISEVENTFSADFSDQGWRHGTLDGYAMGFHLSNRLESVFAKDEHIGLCWYKLNYSIMCGVWTSDGEGGFEAHSYA